MSITINHVLSNKDIAWKIFSEFDSRTLSKCSMVCKLFNKINADMGIKLNDVLRSDEFFWEIFSKLDLAAFMNCSSVCKSWDSRTNRNDLQQKLIPEVFALCENNTRKCLSEHATNSIDKMLKRFKELVEKTERFGAFSFTCVFPYNPDNVLSVKRAPANDDLSIAEMSEMPFDHHTDFCILMKPLTDHNFSYQWATSHPYFCERKFSGMSIEHGIEIANKVSSIIEQHDYPRTYLIRRLHRHFTFLPMWRKILIVGGVAVGLGAIAYYTAPKIKEFCNFFNYKQLDLSE
jgi:hypothetical protein